MRVAQLVPAADAQRVLVEFHSGHDAASNPTRLGDTTDLTYNAADELLGATTPSGTVDFDHDGVGYRVGQTPATGPAVTFEWDQGARLTSYQRANIPSDWVTRPSRGGRGQRYWDPDNPKGNYLRIEEDAIYGHHVHVTSGGRQVLYEGDRHIPFEVWDKWSSLGRP